jgi:hypothetical protein
MMKQIKQLLFILLIAVTITHCNDLTSSQDAELHFEGEVTYMEIEGGFWAIKMDDETYDPTNMPSQFYDPTNLPSEFQKDGLDVTVSANHAKNRVSHRMVGPIIRIVDITRR